jgi:hypothetical protein
MSVPSALTQIPRESPAAPSDLRLHGRWLLLARVGWGALAAVFMGLYVVSLPLYVAFLQTPCGGVACAINGALTPDTVRTLHQLDISSGSYVALFVAGGAVQVLVSCGIGGVIAWRRSDDWMALIVALFLVSFYIGNAGDALDLMPLANPAWGLPIRLVHALSTVLTYLFLYLFPTGRFVPRWTRWIAAVYILQALAESALPRESLLTSHNWPLWFIVLFFASLILPALFAQVYRYRRVSTPAQRQQTKWVVLGIIVTFGGTLGLVIPLLIVPGLQYSGLYNFFAGDLGIGILYTFFPVCIGVAVLRSRLYDIDILINRALVYGTLTGLLAALYFGVVVGVQALVGTLNREAARSPIIVVASTLLIAALFTPLRRGTQETIDRHFYRRKYDATRTLAAFGVTVRNEVELAQLSRQLVAVVQETMQPAHAALWLRAPQRHEGWRVQPDTGTLPPQLAGRRPRDDHALAP